MFLGIEESNHLAENHLYLVDLAAREIGRALFGTAHSNDLVSAGYDGLLEASRRYDPGKEAKFSTFAHRRIRGAMWDHVRRFAGPRSENAPRVVFSSDVAWSAVAVFIDETEVSHGYEAERAVDFRRLRSLVSGLPEKERVVLEGHYFEDQSLVQAGRKVGLSKMQSKRTHARGIMMLRQKLEPSPGNA